jgi:hypothetical protein
MLTIHTQTRTIDVMPRSISLRLTLLITGILIPAT